MRLVSHSQDWFSLAVVPNSDNKCVCIIHAVAFTRCLAVSRCVCVHVAGPSRSLHTYFMHVCVCVCKMCNYANAQRQNRRRLRLRYVRAKRSLLATVFHFLYPRWDTGFTGAAAAVTIVAFCLCTLAAWLSSKYHFRWNQRASIEKLKEI